MLGRKLIAVSGAAALMLSAGCRTPQMSGEQWEYKVVVGNAYANQLTDSLNEQAQDGWTVVSVSTASQGEDSVPKATTVLRRPKQQ